MLALPLAPAPVGDRLTGLADQGMARAAIARWQAEWPDGGGTCPVAAMLVTLSRFEAVNIAFGAEAGDTVLATAAARLTDFAGEELQSEDWLAARLGGASFLLIAHGTVRRARWQWLAEALADALAVPAATGVPGAAGPSRLSPRIALAQALPGEDGAALLERLGEAAARLEGERGRRMAWAGQRPGGTRRSYRQLEADLLSAIDMGHIEVLFQPQYACADDRLTGAEALARWNHPQVGRIGAEALFAIAERADHVAALSHNIARQAVAAAAAWPAHLRLSLNVTAQDLAIRELPRTLADMTTAAGFDERRLTLEITEQALLADLRAAGASLAALRDRGVQIALDDFGAGFCNFAYLKTLPLDAIKLDRSMLDGVPDDARDVAVLRGIIAMAHALKLTVVAEGVETAEQVAFCAAEGCGAYQGFVRSAPVDAAAFLPLTAR